jgi:ABC-type sugar transport system permease subunit
MSKRYTLGVLGYLVPTFALGFVWHLVLFKDYYESLAIYRTDIIIPLGFASMLVQSVLFAWIYDRMFATVSSSAALLVLKYAILGALLSWSFTTLAVGAKNIMSSVPRFMVIETAFTVAQWLMVAPLTVLAFRGVRHSRPLNPGVPTSL